MSYAPQNIHRLSKPHSRVLPTLAARLGIVLISSLASVRNRRAMAGLSDRQLHDVGIDPSVIRGDTPKFKVAAGLMSYLMSLR